MTTPTLEQIWEKSQEHFKEDNDFHLEVRAWREEMRPMLEAFKKNQVKRMVFEEETNTLYIYAKRLTTIGLALVSLWAFIKFFLINLMTK